jgi:diacylglycerol kinase family enzyme
MHAWNIAQTEIQNLDLYAGLVAVGGDGTLHEVINGMMFRADKKKVPIALIPNGTGNDLCNSVGVKSVEQALAFIKKGDLIQMDLNRVLMDAETEEEIPKDDNLF